MTSWRGSAARTSRLWTAQHYATQPVGNGGKARIPTLKVTDDHGHTKSVTTNEEKSAVFSQFFFPKRLADDLVPPDPDYPCWVEYVFGPSMAQLHRCVTRLSLHKAPREDGIPNIVIKESLELIAVYLLEIFQVTFTLHTYSNRWQIWDTIVLHKPGKPRYDIPKAH